MSHSLNLFEEKIYTALNSAALLIDNIAKATDLSTSDCLDHLLSLEFKGLVKQLPGKMFALTLGYLITPVISLYHQFARRR
ncbi:MAG: hypothetical protein IIA49_05430 [Bacteroidetes bacterium]|nr:hypothetical protein [Bacteroidota bacterium]